MKTLAKSVIAAGLLLLTGAGHPGSIEQLSWLNGHWAEESGERWAEEHWTAPRGGAMLGVGRSGLGATMRNFEYMRIAPGKNGTLAFFGSPGGAAAVAFELVGSGPNELVFENAEHDFPQRIYYRRDGRHLIAEVSDLARKQVLHWRYRKLSR